MLGDIDTVTEQVAVRFFDDFADVQTHAQQHALVGRDRSVLPMHGLLDRNRALQCAKGAGEFDEVAIRNAADLSAAALDHRPAKDVSAGIEHFERSRLIGLHETVITGHVCREQRRDLAPGYSHDAP